MASKIVHQGVKQVKPILSTTKDEARRRVLNLYKAWYRQVPYIVKDYDVPITVPQCRDQLRELFIKNKNVTDIRVIDRLVIQGQMDLVETAQIWKQKTHVMKFFGDTVNKKPADFLSKFYDGHE
ncbi:NADH dehydrogenase [ubiquinone] 1 alpha subcomplex subunit 6-like [Lineus longissimus]|uniref:NADH dehydrogenase [ubiquinone] 1 alpha subcomplex subunit 6-like n=1 Tax=Lineus longissimus TaxID=88925 RepID=UPI002B4FAAE4